VSYCRSHFAYGDVVVLSVLIYTILIEHSKENTLYVLLHLVVMVLVYGKGIKKEKPKSWWFGNTVWLAGVCLCLCGVFFFLRLLRCCCNALSEVEGLWIGVGPSPTRCCGAVW